jgi:hypothetical protein
MGSKSETGHAVNAANFSRIIFYCEDTGAKYNPPDAAISVVNLKLKDQKQLDAISLFQDKAGTWMQDVNAREAVMVPINKLATRIKNVAAVCDVLPQFVKDVDGLVKKIQGVRATPKIKTEPADPNTPTDETIVQISAAQTGIDNKLDNLAMLLKLLTKETKYIPNETDLTTAAITALIASAKEKNKAVSTSTPPMESARINRNKEMYAEGTGGADLSAKVKKYMKAVFGGNSPEYHNVAKLEFKKLVK